MGRVWTKTDETGTVKRETGLAMPLQMASTEKSLLPPSEKEENEREFVFEIVAFRAMLNIMMMKPKTRMSSSMMKMMDVDEKEVLAG